MVENQVKEILEKFLPSIFDLNAFAFCERFFTGSPAWQIARFIVADTVIDRSAVQTDRSTKLDQYDYVFSDCYWDLDIKGDGFHCLCRMERTSREKLGQQTYQGTTYRVEITNIVFDGSVEALDNWAIYARLIDPGPKKKS